jgi:nicotinamidase/pyrazinamidase
MTEQGDPGTGDALIVVDMQQDFLPGGALGVAGGDRVVPLINRWIERFEAAGLPIVYSRDWHPPDHCSFVPQGGIWPEHCVADSPGAAFPPSLTVSRAPVIVSKATAKDEEAYSAFQGTGLADLLRARGVQRCFLAGLATDYCVRATVEDALAAGFEAVVLTDGVRAVELEEGDGERALAAMRAAGARLVSGA